tara:strand:- start:89 stop:835 length:747 start_codon:yes stop_codon:yes gene_type:complete
MNTTKLPKNLAIIGAGGIGSNLAELLMPALIRLEITVILSFIDGDVIEEGNIGHQRYVKSEIGEKKVGALYQRLNERPLPELEAMKAKHEEILATSSRLTSAIETTMNTFLERKQSFLMPIEENLRHKDQLSEFDMIIVCVDRPEPRRLVHNSGKPWIDLRCTGDGWMILTSDSNPALVEKMTPDHEPKSCQIAGALENGNLEFGFAVAAAYGAQWVIQTLRGQPGPVQAMGSLTYGSFEFPTVEGSA